MDSDQLKSAFQALDPTLGVSDQDLVGNITREQFLDNVETRVLAKRSTLRNALEWPRQCTRRLIVTISVSLASVAAVAAVIVTLLVGSGSPALSLTGTGVHVPPSACKQSAMVATVTGPASPNASGTRMGNITLKNISVTCTLKTVYAGIRAVTDSGHEYIGLGSVAPTSEFSKSIRIHDGKTAIIDFVIAPSKPSCHPEQTDTLQLSLPLKGWKPIFVSTQSGISVCRSDHYGNVGAGRLNG
jgi:hypothetical protein